MRKVFLEKGAVVVKNVSEPVLHEHAVLVSVHYSFVSAGTERATVQNSTLLAMFNNLPKKIRLVLDSLSANGVEGTKALVKNRLKGQVHALGYSCSGQVIAVGSAVRNFKAGDWVACAGAGLADHADVVCVPENLVVPVAQEWLKQASVTTIGAIAMQGVRRASVQLGETVCVIGLGLIGQLTVQLLKAAGVRVVGIDIRDDRLALAKDSGADWVFNSQNDSVAKEIEFITEHHGVDCTIITAASSSDAIVQQAMEFTRRKGRVVLVGDVGLSLQRNPFYKKEIDFLISCSYGPGRYDQEYEHKGVDYPYAYVRWTENRNMRSFVRLIQSGAVRLNELLSHEVAVSNVEQAYALIKNAAGLGVVLSYLPKSDLSFIPAQKDTAGQVQLYEPKSTIRLGVVGAGGFAKIKLLPIVSKIKNVHIDAVVDADIANAINTSRLYTANRSFASESELYAQDFVDAVLIASPHTYHCDQALTALRKGKAVFVEKPSVTTQEQWERMHAFLTTHPTVPFCVDYNRSFSPFLQKISRVVRTRKSPLVMHYRMNAGFIPKEHWVQTEVGAGRIIGEACHIFDLFNVLVGSRPVSVSVEALHSSREDLFATDNFSAQLSFEDGSVCSLLYTALGHAGPGKERLEAFFDGKSIIMDDYKTLRGFGVSKDFDETTSSPDKGHATLLNRFFTEIQKDRPVMPINFERLLTTEQIALTVDQLACKGGGESDIPSLTHSIGEQQLQLRS